MNLQHLPWRRLMNAVLAAVVLWTIMPFGVRAANGTFSDVDARRYSWAIPSIGLMAAKQVLTGYPDGRFYPEKSISKAEWTIMVYRLFDKYRPNLNAAGLRQISYFTDLPESHWAFQPISEIYDTSFSLGGYGLNRNGDLAFRPEQELTRLQLALMLAAFFDNRLIDQRINDKDACSLVTTFKDIPVKFLSNTDDYSTAASDGRYVSDGLMTVETQDVYPLLLLGRDGGNCSLGDDPLSNTELRAFASLQASGIMTANDNGYFRPLDRVTRAEAVTIMERIYRYLKKSYWLSDYSSIDLDSAGGGAPTGGSSGIGTGTGGTGTDSSFTYNPDRNVITPDNGPANGGATWSDKSIIHVQDYFNDKGIISKDLQQMGEIETAVQPQGNKYLTIDLKSKEKVDLYVILDGQIGFVKQEELPITISVSGVSVAGLRTQQRVPQPNKKGDFTATLAVKLSVDDPNAKKK